MKEARDKNSIVRLGYAVMLEVSLWNVVVELWPVKQVDVPLLCKE